MPGKKVSPRLQKLEEDFRKNGGRFEAFKVGDIFTIQTGSLVSKKKLIPGKVARLSVTSQNNGIIGYYDTENTEEARHYENFISINFLGNVFYHPYKASCEMKVHILKLKNHSFTQQTGLYIAGVLRKVIEGNYSYGEQLSSSDLKKNNIYITLPVHANNQLAFSYMENYVRELEAYLRASGLNDYTLTDEEQALRERERDVNYAEFAFPDIFHKAKTGDTDIQRRHVNGKGEIYINSGRENQGIVGRTDVKARVFPARTITVDMFGYAWYRDFTYKMATHAHVFSLETKEKYSENALLYLVAAMFHLKNKYSYNNMCNWTKMCQEKVCLPVTSSGSPDLDFMETKIRTVKKITVKHLVQWKDRELEVLNQVVSE